MLAETLDKPSFTAKYDLFVEMIAIEVDGLSRIDFSTHQDDSVFEGHRQVNFVVVIEREETLHNCVVSWVEPWIGNEVLS